MASSVWSLAAWKRLVLSPAFSWVEALSLGGRVADGVVGSTDGGG
jgi:hypothetical protein